LQLKKKCEKCSSALVESFNSKQLILNLPLFMLINHNANAFLKKREQCIQSSQKKKNKHFIIVIEMKLRQCKQFVDNYQQQGLVSFSCEGAALAVDPYDPSFLQPPSS
jgi:hypothetical protein